MCGEPICGMTWRNRLNLVLGYSEEWREILDGNAPREVIEDLQIVYRAGRNCLRHLDEIFAPPGQVAQRDTSDIRDIIQDALRMPARRASELGHILIVDDDRFEPGCAAAAARTHRAFG